MSNIDKEIGLRLKVARKTAGYKTALTFSNNLKIPKSTYSQHENGKRSLTADHLMYYANKMDVEASWLLTGQGHPCPMGSNKNWRKDKIEEEIKKLQETEELPYLKDPHIEINDNSAVVNMQLFSKILTSAITAITSKNLGIKADELVAFCVDVYNNTEFLETSQDEKSKIINLSVNSMLRGSHIILKKTINL